MSEQKVLTKEDFYKEDFKCFRHYIILKDNKMYNKVISTPLMIDEGKSGGRKHFKVVSERNYNKTDENEYRNVIIFDEIPNLDLTKFYKTNDFSYSPWALEVCFKHEMLVDTNIYEKDTRIFKGFCFHLSKLNYNWEVKNISEEKELKLKNGTIIPYRTATIIIKQKDEKKLKIEKGKIVADKN